MGIFSIFKNNVKAKPLTTKYEMVVSDGNGFFSWNGNLYQSDIIRSIVRTKSQAIGKAVAKHIRKDAIEPDLYMKFLLKQPNPVMTGQMLQEKLAVQLELNNNAFALITRDEMGTATAIYPLNSANSFEGIIDDQGNIYVRFNMTDGRILTFKYSDLIHLRKDYNENELFGEPFGATLDSLMTLVKTVDTGIVKAVENSNAVRWLLQYNQSLRPEDIKENTKEFAKSFLSTSSESFGVAGVDNKAEAKQVQVNPYTPGKDQLKMVTDRIYGLFNINDEIVHSSYTENQWISFYESQIEPILMQLSDQYTIKLFNRREQSFGNEIQFESSSMTYASMQTKLSLVNFVDRGIMSPNEVRSYFNFSPRDGGDEFILRKDTGKESDLRGGDNNENTNQGNDSTE